MIRRDLRSREITDNRVLASMNWVPRERFVPFALRPSAYADIPLPVGHGQTISQPFIVAWMTQLARLTRRSRVLEVGTGTGYHTAVIAKIARHVWSVERIESLSSDAAARLERLGIGNVTLVVGDGAYGSQIAAPFDAVIVAAAAPEAPKPLIEQLADGGRLVIPLGDYAMQDLTVIERQGDRYNRQTVGPCRFVPFVSDLIDHPPPA